MLNGTLCATERAMCCLVENYQTPEVRLPGRRTTLERGLTAHRQGLNIPEVLQPYMQGRSFIPFVREAPKRGKK